MFLLFFFDLIYKAIPSRLLKLIEFKNRWKLDSILIIYPNPPYIDTLSIYILKFVKTFLIK